MMTAVAVLPGRQGARRHIARQRLKFPCLGSSKQLNEMSRRHQK